MIRFRLFDFEKKILIRYPLMGISSQFSLALQYDHRSYTFICSFAQYTPYCRLRHIYIN